MATMNHARWHVVVYYRSEAGLVDIEHLVNELREVHELIERGPHWNTVERIKIKRVNHTTSPELTIETAARM